MRLRRTSSSILAATMALVCMLATAACGDVGTPPPSGSSVRGEVVVLAASSLTAAFTRIGHDFERANPGTSVTISFGGSAALATQIGQGAPVDVFAAASPTTMKMVTGAGNAAGTPTVFARNQLVIAVSTGNPRHITGLADLTTPGVRVAVCAPAVPCGAAATTVLAAANVDLHPVTQEQDVKATLAKLTLGEVDAALVYRTDAAAASTQVDAVEFVDSAKAINEYLIVVLARAPNPTAAEAFVAYVRSGPARSVLAAAGFQLP